jgi:hypothetical protein
MGNRILILIFFGSIFFSSCRKIPDPITKNGIIAGYAGLYPNSIDDSIEVTARGPYGKASTMTDINGLFKFKGLGNGTYSLIYSKPGYGSIRQYGLQMFGNDSIRVEYVRLFKTYDDYKIPEFERVYIGAMPRSSATNCLILTTKQKLGYFPLLFFMSTGKEVNYRNFKYTEGHYWVRGPFETPNYDIIYIELNYLPFNHGDKVYLIGYVCNLDEFDSGFFDRYTGYPALSTLMPDNHTPVMEFILP